MLNRAYISFMLFLSGAILIVAIDSNKRNKEAITSQLYFANLTKITEPALNTSLLEDRFLYNKVKINREYIELLKIDRAGFIYAK